MVSVLISSESRYKVNKAKIRQMVEELLGRAGLDQAEVSLLVAGERKMASLNYRFRKVKKATDVLSFPQESARGPDEILRLGDIIICYPIARAEAAQEGKMVDEKICELVEHGLRHLLGEHHD